MHSPATRSARSRASTVLRTIGRWLSATVLAILLLAGAWWAYQAWPVALPPAPRE